MKVAFVAWTRFNQRSQLLGEPLGAEIYYVSFGQNGRPLQAPLRYVVQGYKTWQLLTRDKPEVVLVQNPPIFSVLAVALYARRYGARYVIDSHTGAFLSPKWRWALPLHARLSRSAAATIVTNTHLEKVVHDWGAKALIVGFAPGQYPPGEAFPLDGGCNLAVVSTSAEDEPLEAVFEAARRLTDVHFYVTGDDKRLAASIVAGKPANCHFTGYLPYGQYVGLLRGANAVLDLTTRDHTLLLGGFEAVSLGTPLITSDFPVLRQYFRSGAVHVRNDADGIADGIVRLRREEPALREGVSRLRDELDEEWRSRFAELTALLKD